MSAWRRSNSSVQTAVKPVQHSESSNRTRLLTFAAFRPLLNVIRMDPTIIILPELLGLVGFLLWIALTAWERRRRLQLISEFQMRLIDRMGSLKEFSEFVRTEEGQGLMKVVMTDPQSDTSRSGIVRALQIGVVLLFLSVGLFAVGRAVVIEAGQTRQLFDVFSILCLSLAVGSLASGLLAARMDRGIAIDRTRQ